MTSFPVALPVAMPELNLVQDFLSGLTLPGLGLVIALFFCVKTAVEVRNLFMPPII